MTTMATERHPIQNLIDQACEQFSEPEYQAFFTELLMSAYATGYLKGNK